MKYNEIDIMPKVVQGIIYNRIASNLDLEQIDLNGEQFRYDIKNVLEYLNKITKKKRDFKESDLWTIDAEDSRHTLVKLANSGQFVKFVAGQGWQDTDVWWF